MTSSPAHAYQEHFKDSGLLEAYHGFKRVIASNERAQLTQAARLAAPRLTDDLRVLDIGCGDAQLTWHFLGSLLPGQRVKEYVGVDLSDGQLAEAERTTGDWRAPVTLIKADASIWRPSESKDLILSLNSWYGLGPEHVTAYRRQLRPGGLLAIVLNARRSTSIRMARELGTEPILDAEQLHDAIDDPFRAYDLQDAEEMRPETYGTAGMGASRHISRDGSAFCSYVMRSPENHRKAERWLLAQERPVMVNKLILVSRD